jgi:uncharacterized damage-inducible protein DinB
MNEEIIQEIEMESVATRRLIERVPEEKLTWKPHSKSMTLGQLALHVATIPGSVATVGKIGTITAAELIHHAEAKSKAEILEGFDESIAIAKKIISETTPEKLSSIWTVTDGETTLMSLPLQSLYRVLMLNHWYHHRGQLNVYLRLLDIPLSSVYGPSADENPFG